MEVYANRRGNSPITHYSIGSKTITVWFKGGKPYTYSYYGGAGQYHVEEMKNMARAGSGPSAYITRNVRDDFDK
ncbi:hypothetical protein AREALGSMS7_01325 [Arenibacter algicola]|uniref:KTSC domain-containing protein n=1 Tax=Arenibacter algicola TaxID=616991 RepID=A0A221UUC2_9FLAO|nr:hypothetical protein AREALGSMS7_01325 [Arenibacter algicola]